MSLDFVPVMYAVQIGLLLIAIQLVSAAISWRTGNIGLLVVSSTITISAISAFLAVVVLEVLGLPFPALPIALLVAANVAVAHSFFALRGLKRFAQATTPD